ncbi:putative methylesterase 11, chloroplastic [Wolffia australiana]
MGSMLSCVSDKEGKRKISRASKGVDWGSIGSWGNPRKEVSEGSIGHEQVMTAALLLRQNGVGSPFARSVSTKHCPTPQEGLVRSSSTRARSVFDPLLQPHQLVGQGLKIEELESDVIVLVHGGGFGAWCWYKTMAYLKECGFRVVAVDLNGSGSHYFDPNCIKSLSQYTKPLINYLEKVKYEEKVILVGHDLGGTCISFAMELFPAKIAKAVFIAAPMLQSGQSTLDMFSLEEGADDLMRQGQEFIYGNGHNKPPTAIDFKRSSLKDLMFNQSPNKDVVLASVSMKAMPFMPLLEKLSLSSRGYGSVRRFYIETTEDNVIPLSLQRAMCRVDPPEKVFRLKGADHSPFFSKPQALHKLLLEISKIPKKNTCLRSISQR